MSSRRSKITRTAAVAMALSICAASAPASAAGLFETLFGAFRRASPPPSVQAYAPDPVTGFLDRLTGNNRGQVTSAQSSGPSRGFCVRTCDGMHFPVQNRPGMSAAEMCSSFCPAAPTKVFAGGNIDSAVASDGTRYADMDTAFLYRTRLSDNCTCNGKSPGGLATLNNASDPTLRPGDIVATGTGLVTYSGNKTNKLANFTPVDPARFNKTDREKLERVKIMPTAESETTASIPAAQITPVRNDTRRSELDTRQRVIGQ